MTATRDFLEATSNEFNQAVIRAKEAVTGQKSARIATRCRQVLEDAWAKYNTAYAQYAAKLKEPATKAEAQSVWLGEMRSYEVALDALEEYLEDQQGEPGNTQGDTAVLLAKEAVAAAVQEALRRQGSLDAQLSKELNTNQVAFLQQEVARMREDLGNNLEAAYAGLIEASADEDKVKVAKEKAAELTEVNKKLDESLEVLRQQVREEERATDGTRTDDIAESVTAAVTASVKQEKEGGTEIKEEEAKSKEAEKRKVGKKKKKKKKKGDDDDEALDAMLAALRAEYTGDAPLEDEAASSNPAAAQEENSKKKRKKESPPQEDDDRQDREVDYMSDESSDSEEEEEEKADAKGVDQDEGLSKMLDSEESSDENKDKDKDKEDEDKKGAAAEKVEMTKEAEARVEVKKVEMMKESEARVEVKKEKESKRKGEENLERHEEQKDGVEEKTSAEEAETLTGSPKTAVQKKDEKDSKQLQKLKEEKEKESKGGKPQAQEEKKPEAVKEARPENEDEVEGEEEKNMKKSKQENDNKVGLRLFNVKVEVMQRGDVITKVLLSAMMLCNFVRLYISEVLVLVALNVARFVIVSPMSSRTFAERFLPHLSDYG